MKTKSLIKIFLLGTVLASTVACQHRNTNDPLARADSDMRKVLEAQAALNPKPIETLTPAEARIQPSPADGVKKVLADEGKDPMPKLGVATRDITVDGAAGKLAARVYYPDAASMPMKKGTRELLPVVLYFHGGGWVIADINTYDSTPRAISKAANAIVVSVEYRHAPENKFPSAHDDAYAAYKWLLAHAQSIGADASRIALLGESAGGNLAINTAIKARDNNVQRPLYQALIYPVAGVDMNTQSYQENANAKPLNKAMMSWFVKNVTRSEKDIQDPRLDLIGKANLADLPPTTIVTAEIDPLRTDGELLAKKLSASGVSVELKEYEGVTHEFFGMGLVVDDAKDAELLVAKNLKSAFKK